MKTKPFRFQPIKLVYLSIMIMKKKRNEKDVNKSSWLALVTMPPRSRLNEVVRSKIHSERSLASFRLEAASNIGEN